MGTNTLKNEKIINSEKDKMLRRGTYSKHTAGSVLNISIICLKMINTVLTKIEDIAQTAGEVVRKKLKGEHPLRSQKPAGRVSQGGDQGMTAESKSCKTMEKTQGKIKTGHSGCTWGGRPGKPEQRGGTNKHQEFCEADT